MSVIYESMKINKKHIHAEEEEQRGDRLEFMDDGSIWMGLIGQGKWTGPV